MAGALAYQFVRGESSPAELHAEEEGEGADERVAVITDIHANLPALEAALGRIDELGIERSTAAATWSATARIRTRSAR